MITCGWEGTMVFYLNSHRNTIMYSQFLNNKKATNQYCYILWIYNHDKDCIKFHNKTYHIGRRRAILAIVTFSGFRVKT